ncbi:hypothetical protein SAICODRAFT_23501 [Saitoella complicata NRRL Y-17804]|uniref:uncharacterized protein n=1 Tax=Saitoella complicata (strain BCRC 22490 / CBS 7301 / JCM 7358 / NBRC 10748 / NRRL Y-17804) TaxID=698492 RepID=UPI0008673DBD|nr:uncharacterized protein SAICODRAFT_23501 [Saitoella complicata NRRL Y-17804]ODQ55465.1 hypothetical protein SAICODRAFT_23501 [Saitoella complicata NRRL Y-17804]
MDHLDLTARQQHYLKKELLSQQLEDEIALLSSPAALSSFGPPFRSSALVDPSQCPTPILRFVFTRYVQTFPFLKKVNQEEFWGGKVQAFYEAFLKKNISTTDDREEDTKRRMMGSKLEKMIGIMMNAGLKTASGQEEGISVLEAEKNSNGKWAKDHASGTQGFKVNVCAVRMEKERRHLRKQTHAYFLVRTSRPSQSDVITAHRYGDFCRLHKELTEEFPGKEIPRLPQKNKTATSTRRDGTSKDDNASINSSSSNETTPPPSPGIQSAPESSIIPREKNRLTLRAFIRALVHDPQIVRSTNLIMFLTADPIHLTPDDIEDEARRAELDVLRTTELSKFTQVAQARARELDAHMSTFKKDLVQRDGLSRVFRAIKEKDTIAELPEEYQKVVEWARIEVAATIYHLFVAQDNSSETFATAKRVHGLMPYMVLKNIIRFSNPMAMMRGILDLFLATPFGQKVSLMQRIFSMSLSEDIGEIKKSINILQSKIGDSAICTKLKLFAEAAPELQEYVRAEAVADDVDLMIAVMRSNIGAPLNSVQMQRVLMAYVAWNEAVDCERVDDVEVQESDENAKLYAWLIQLLRLEVRLTDKQRLNELLFEGVTGALLKDIFSIFYEPLAKVYKAASIHNSISDFSAFMDDLIKVVEQAESQDLATDPNRLVQSFIDLCARHQESFYRFVHQVHKHDTEGLFDALMRWIELILMLLREGFPQRIDLALLFTEDIDRQKALQEVDTLIQWNGDRKLWREARLRAKLAAMDDGTVPTSRIKASDFGLDEADVEELAYGEDEADATTMAREQALEEADPVEAERRRRQKMKKLNEVGKHGEPVKPLVHEIRKMHSGFEQRIRDILNDALSSD